MDLIQWCLDSGASVCLYDPVAASAAQRYFEDRSALDFREDQYAVLEDADALVIVTEWKSFREPNFEVIKEKMKSACIVDGRNLYSRKKMQAHGIRYSSVGRRDL